MLATMSACQDLADIALQALQGQMAERGYLIDRLKRDLQASCSQLANSQSTLKKEVIHFPSSMLTVSIDMLSWPILALCSC